MVEAKANLVTWTAKRRVMSKKICLEEIVGFSFFETNIKTPELISISVKVKSQEKMSTVFKGEIRSSL
jgi:hypothetical protein